MTWGQFEDRCMVHEEEIFPASELLVGNTLGSSCISRMQWRLVTGYCEFTPSSNL